MRVLAVFCFVCLLVVVAFGQSTGTLTGKVRTGKGGRVGNASVELVRQSNVEVIATTRTNSRGEFRFDAVPSGSYLVRTQPSQGDADVKIGGGDVVDTVLVLDPALPAASRIRESVTVSAGATQTVEQVSKTVDVVTQQEMRDRADFSLVESLRTIPGFRVQQLGGFGRTASIKTRGLRNQDTAILIDGIRFRDASAITGDASPFLSDFTLTSVSKIEVLRGSGSSLYGTNAVGGVVDFQTPETKSGTHGQIGGAFGGLGLGRFRGNLSHGTRGGKFGIGGGVSRTVYTKGIDGQDNAYNTNLQTRIDANPFAKTSISGRIFFSDGNVRLNSSPDTFGRLPVTNQGIINAIPSVNITFDANDPDSFQKSRFFDGQISVNQVINTKLLLSGYYQGLTTRRTNDNGPLGVGFQPFGETETSIFDGTIHTGNVHISWTPSRENTLTAGYEFESERFGNIGKTTSGIGNFFTKAGQNSNTFYLQDLVSLMNSKLQLAGGLRVQRFRLDGPSFSVTNAPYSNLTLTNPPTAYTFDGSAAYFFTKSRTKLRAHVGNGYRVPSLFERFGTFFATFLTPNRFVPLGAPNLKPERTIAFDAGIEQNLFGSRARLSATYFYTRLTDIIGFGRLPQPDPFGRDNFLSGGGYLNSKGGIARGGEFSVTAKARSSTDIFASYTFTNSDQRAPQVSGSGILKTLGIPDHQFTLVATQRFGRAWVNFDFLATSTYLAPIFSNSVFRTYIYRFRGNRKGDLTGGYTFAIKNEKTLRLYGTIENIFNREYFENGFRTAKATGRVGLSFGF